MDYRPHLKTLLIIVASSASGFYIGGRYVGGLATRGGDMKPIVGPRPAWIGTAQDTLWYMLVLFLLAVLGWIVIDIAEAKHA